MRDLRKERCANTTLVSVPKARRNMKESNSFHLAGDPRGNVGSTEGAAH